MKIAIFTVNGKDYGVDISGVQQVIRMRTIVPVPDAADFVEGVISLRDKVIPVVSLSRKLGIKDEKPGRWSRIIIARIEGHLMGIVVDAVTDVITIDPASMSEPDEVLKDAGYLIGVAKLGNRLILIADMDRLLSVDEKASIKTVSGRVEVKKRS